MRTQVHDLVIAYDEAGHGRPVVLIHGYPLSRRIWRTQLEGLDDAARVIALDLPGSGESDVPPPPYTVERLADDVADWLDALNITEPAVIAGLSMGGYVALAFHRRHADRTAGLILAATRAGADSEAGKANRDKSIALAKDQGVTAIAEAMLPKLLAPETYHLKAGLVHEVRQIMTASPQDGVIGDLGAMRDRPDATEQLSGIHQPVLVIHGQADQLIPPSEAESAYGRLTNGRLALLPGAGHLLNMEQPEAFNAEVRTFLRAIR